MYGKRQLLPGTLLALCSVALVFLIILTGCSSSAAATTTAVSPIEITSTAQASRTPTTTVAPSSPVYPPTLQRTTRPPTPSISSPSATSSTSIIPTASPKLNPKLVNTKIAFNSATNFNIYVINADGTGLTQLTKGDPTFQTTAAGTRPAWSPNGLKIAFYSYDKGTNAMGRTSDLSGLYVMNADGTDRTRVTLGSSISPPSWSPDGTKIVFADNKSGFNSIYTISADGSNLTKLTNNPEPKYPADETLDEFPAWSPDGKKIAFDSSRNGKSEIFIMNSDGSGRVQLTGMQADFSGNQYPAWSPDGKKIAFDSFRDGNSEIYVMNADGSNQTRLTKDPATDQKPSWSPDGSEIAFLSWRETGYSEIFIMNADGSDPRMLAKTGLGPEYPAWSPPH